MTLNADYMGRMIKAMRICYPSAIFQLKSRTLFYLIPIEIILEEGDLQ